jgi:transcriptional regulator
LYIPSSFAETRPEIMHALMQQHPLGSLVTLEPDGLNANHLPFELDADVGEFGVLRAHAARANPFWRSLAKGVDVMVIFQGPQAYISPQWYPSKQENGKAVPTWNYISVHAHGPLIVHDNPIWLRGQLDALTRRHEAGQAVPWRIDEAPAAYIDQLLTMIVGIEIPIRRLQGKWKVSQNQSASNRQGVIDGLRQHASAQTDVMAMEIVRRREQEGATHR